MITPIIILGGVCIDEEHLHGIETKVSQLAEKVFGDSAVSQETEFHAAEIYHRKKTSNCGMILANA